MELYLYFHIRLHGVDRNSTFFTLSVIFHKAGVLSGNAVDVHSESTLFESRQVAEYPYFILFVVILSQWWQSPVCTSVI